MQLETLKLLEDVRLAAERIGDFTGGRSLDDYRSDALLRSAIERQFEIIGEALSQLSRRDPETTRRVSDYRLIIAFRNQLIHRYRTIDHDVVWGLIESDLPILLGEARSLIAEGDPTAFEQDGQQS